ncbi:MAG TPA: D-alanine--D-alanine ligase [Phycisphaerales bacterium]|nr:D-alanine--D-alanine ligase [Phycisphaerales bacterium]
MKSVLVLGGGPGAERDVSIASSTAVARALERAGLNPTLVMIDQPEDLNHHPGDVIFPVLHGWWGEGGPLQDILERDGRPYVGSGPSASRLCMDKIATKLEAARLGVRTPPAVLFNPEDRTLGMNLPLVLKPALEGSSVGLHVCTDANTLKRAVSQILDDRANGHAPVIMAERFIEGREVTCSIIESDGEPIALPLIEIKPAAGVYDYDAKYDRDDTRYFLDPEGIDPEPIVRDAISIARALGVRHVARADFVVDAAGRHWFLEINTIPGFTDHSLLPMAAAGRGIDMPDLCAHLVASACGSAPRAGAAVHSSSHGH